MCLCRLNFGEEDGLVVFAAGPPIAVTALLVWCAVLIPWVGIPVALWSAVVLSAFPVALDVKRKVPWKFQVHPAEMVFLLLGVLTAVFFAVHILSMKMVVEDSFFVHTAWTGLMLTGFFPPVNFLGEETHGHFGRDLLIALHSELTSIHFLNMEWLFIAGCQALSFILLYAWLRKETGSRTQAAFATAFVFGGANYASYVGLFDTLTNNQSAATLAWVVAGYCFFRVLEGRGWALAAVVMAADAFIYEIHFVMIMAASLGLCLFVARSHFKPLLAFLLLTGFLTVIGGGALSHIVLSKLGFHQATGSLQEQEQNQKVKIEIPKERLFEVRLDNLRPSRPFETKFRSWKADFTPSREYASIFSQQVLNVFWYPVWLAPLTLVFVIWNRHRVAGWFFGMGSVGWLIPAFIGFGFFEQETGRWLLFVSVGYTVAFGLMVGWLATEVKKPWRIPALLFVAWATVFGFSGLPRELQDIRYVYQNPGSPAPDGSPAVLEGAPFFPSPRFSMAHHLRIEAADWAAASWLRRHAEADHRFMMNYGDEPVMGQPPGELPVGSTLNRLGCVIGLVGLLPAGTNGAPANEWSAGYCGQSMQARLYWSTGDPDHLAPLQVDWLLVNAKLLQPSVLATIKESQGVKLEYEEDQRLVFRVEGDRQVGPLSNATLRVEAVPLPVAPHQPFELRLAEPAPNESWVQFRFRETSSGLVANDRDRLTVRLAPRTSLQGTSSQGKSPSRPTVPLLAPYRPGHYLIEYSRGDEWEELTELTVEEAAPKVSFAPLPGSY